MSGGFFCLQLLIKCQLLYPKQSVCLSAGSSIFSKWIINCLWCVRWCVHRGSMSVAFFNTLLCKCVSLEQLQTDSSDQREKSDCSTRSITVYFNFTVPNEHTWTDMIWPYLTSVQSNVTPPPPCAFCDSVKETFPFNRKNLLSVWILGAGNHPGL